MKVDFFIVGAPKAGTTSLYHYLNEHPEIVMSRQKETDYFSDEDLQKKGLYYGKNRINTLEKYHSLFQNADQKKTGEASVSYLFYEDVPQKIKAYNSNGKIIIMLRNPVDRAFSHYLMDYRLGLISKSFESILENEKKDIKTSLFYQQYIELGQYSGQVKRYIEKFGKENVTIIFYYDFKNHVVKEVQKVYEFLEVDSKYRAEIENKHNTYSMPKNNWIRLIYSFVSFRKILNRILPKRKVRKIKEKLFIKSKKPKLSDVLRARLINLYAHDIKQLEELLSVDLSQWKK
jgi:hypothetical protein